MIKLSNGHQFKYVASDNFWCRRFVDLSKFTIITKMITLRPIKRNSYFCTRYLGDGNFVNWSNLANPGIEKWVKKRTNQDTIVSIKCENIYEALGIGVILDEQKWIKGIEVNIFHQSNKFEQIIDILEALKSVTSHPIGVKVGLNNTIQDKFVGLVEWVNAIHPISYWTIYGNFKYDGFVSGPATANQSKMYCYYVKIISPQLKIISGGGIDSFEEANLRLKSGIDAISFDSIFIRKPWLPNKIIKRLELENG